MPLSLCGGPGEPPAGAGAQILNSGTSSRYRGSRLSLQVCPSSALSRSHTADVRRAGYAAQLTLFLEELEERGRCPDLYPDTVSLSPVEVDPELRPESAEYLVALEQATAALEQCVNLCKAHVMMVTCFDIGVAATAAVPGPQEVDV